MDDLMPYYVVLSSGFPIVLPDSYEDDDDEFYRLLEHPECKGLRNAISWDDIELIPVLEDWYRDQGVVRREERRLL